MDKLLPIGSVVLLEDSTKKVMIMGLCQREVSEEGTLWDYAGILYPEGYIGANKIFLFNREQVIRCIFLVTRMKSNKILDMMEDFIKEKRKN